MAKKDTGEEIIIYRTRITLRNGKPLYAHQVGLKAFRLRVKRKPKN